MLIFFVVKLNVLGILEIIKIDKIFVDFKWILLIEDGGVFIINYVIEYRFSGFVRWNRVNSFFVIEIIFSVVDFKEGFEYEFRVFVENKVGVGSFFEFFKFVKVEKLLGKNCY